MEPSLQEKEQTLHIIQSSESGNYEMKKLVLKIRKQIYKNEEVSPTCIQKIREGQKGNTFLILLIVKQVPPTIQPSGS